MGMRACNSGGLLKSLAIFDLKMLNSDSAQPLIIVVAW